MYPAFIQLQTRLRLAEKWLENRDTRRSADDVGANSTSRHSTPFPDDTTTNKPSTSDH
jgi:hypothetical protein